MHGIALDAVYIDMIVFGNDFLLLFIGVWTKLCKDHIAFNGCPLRCTPLYQHNFKKVCVVQVVCLLN